MYTPSTTSKLEEELERFLEVVWLVSIAVPAVVRELIHPARLVEAPATTPACVATAVSVLADEVES